MPDVGAHVVGVNDCWKFGKPVNELLFLNRPRHFNEPCIGTDKQRIDVIKETPCSQVIVLDTIASEWEKMFPDKIRVIKVTRFRKEYKPMQLYHSDSSPFTAMSYAVTLGFKEIVLWGVDLIDHKYLKPETSAPVFNQFAQAVEKYGVNIYKGNRESNLSLRVWEQPL